MTSKSPTVLASTSLLIKPRYARRCHHRGRPLGVGCSSIWCFRRAWRSGARNELASWSGRFKFKNRKLFGISYRYLGRRARSSKLTTRHKNLAEILIGKGTRLVCDRKPYIIEVENGPRIPARTVIVATGAEYRRPPCKNLSRFEGATMLQPLWKRNYVQEKK